MLYAISILAIVVILCLLTLAILITRAPHAEEIENIGFVNWDKGPPHNLSDAPELILTTEFAVTPHDSDGGSAPTASPNLINPAEVCEIPLADDCGGARLRIGTAASVFPFHGKRI